VYILKGFLGDRFDRVNKIIDSYNNIQNNYINLEACCSYPFESVMEAQKYPIHTLPTEGVTGNRYFPTFDCVEDIDIYSEELVRELFQIDNDYMVSTQPHSGTQANQIVYNSILNSNDIVLSLCPKDGGHISHSKISNKQNRVINYHLNSSFEFDYDEINELIHKHRPKLIIVGASSFPNEIDYERIAEIAHKNGVFLLADICHTVLYIMAQTHPNVFPHADFVTFTMDKTLRGPQGGIIVYKKEFKNKIAYSIFPTSQGGPLQSIQFAKMVALVELKECNVQKYATSVQDNAKLICSTLLENGISVITNRTNTHIILINAAKLNRTGKEMEHYFFNRKILVNKNLIPNDIYGPDITSGIRIGSVCITNLNYKPEDVVLLGNIISKVLLKAPIIVEETNYLLEKYHKNINISN
jgi:glycine hydroxymethyltransferase